MYVRIKIHINIRRSRPPRRTRSAYRPTSQPFSACNCRRENYLLGTLPDFFLLSLLRKHSTAQHSTARSTRTSSKTSTCRSERDIASNQTDGESQHVVEHLYSSLCSQNEGRNRDLPGLRKCATIHITPSQRFACKCRNLEHFRCSRRLE